MLIKFYKAKERPEESYDSDLGIIRPSKQTQIAKRQHGSESELDLEKVGTMLHHLENTFHTLTAQLKDRCAIPKLDENDIFSTLTALYQQLP